MANEEYKNYLSTARKKTISEHFTLFEVIYSDTALKFNIDNRPTAQILYNATALCKNVLEKIRTHFNAPVIVHCMYRCPALNTKVGGVSTSQHVTGQAVDFHVENHTIEEVFNYIKQNLLFDQLIQEGTWIHCSFNLVKNRRQSLRLVNGKYISA